MKKDDYILLVKKYKRQILQCSALAVTVMCACGISYMAGRYSGRQKAPAAAGSEGGTEETTSQYTDLPPGSPSFLFPPGTAFREATPSNVDIMDSQVLNLAYLYEDGADSTDPADSYAGRLYDMLALRMLHGYRDYMTCTIIHPSSSPPCWDFRIQPSLHRPASYRSSATYPCAL